MYLVQHTACWWQDRKRNLGSYTPTEASISFCYFSDDFLNQKAFFSFPCRRRKRFTLNCFKRLSRKGMLHADIQPGIGSSRSKG